MSNIPQEMKALRVKAKGDTHYSLETIPVPRPKAYEALIKTQAGGMCHTDMLVFTGEFPSTYPVTGSHEPSGIVVALGEEAEKSKVIPLGARVAGLLPLGICYECRDCKNGETQRCASSKSTGFLADGAFAEYEILDSRQLVPIPDNMPFEQVAPLTCAGVTIYTAIKKTNLKPGQIIAISGLGALGHLGVQMAKAMGLKVVGVDARPEPIAMTNGLKLAPDLCINARETTAEQAVKEIVKLRPEGYDGWDGVDAVILTADPAASHGYAIDITRRRGTIVVVAAVEKIVFKYQDFVFQDLTVIGSLHGSVQDLKETIELCHEHGIKSEVKAWKIEEHKQMIDAMHAEDRKGKNVLVF